MGFRVSGWDQGLCVSMFGGFRDKVGNVVQKVLGRFKFLVSAPATSTWMEICVQVLRARYLGLHGQLHGSLNSLSPRLVQGHS